MSRASVPNTFFFTSKFYREQSAMFYISYYFQKLFGLSHPRMPKVVRDASRDVPAHSIDRELVRSKARHLGKLGEPCGFQLTNGIGANPRLALAAAHGKDEGAERRGELDLLNYFQYLSAHNAELALHVLDTL